MKKTILTILLLAVLTAVTLQAQVITQETQFADHKLICARMLERFEDDISFYSIPEIVDTSQRYYNFFFDTLSYHPATLKFFFRRANIFRDIVETEVEGMTGNEPDFYYRHQIGQLIKELLIARSGIFETKSGDDVFVFNSITRSVAAGIFKMMVPGNSEYAIVTIGYTDMTISIDKLCKEVD